MHKTVDSKVENREGVNERSILHIIYKFLCVTNGFQISICVIFAFMILYFLMKGYANVRILGGTYTIIRLVELLGMLVVASLGWYVIRIILGKVMQKKYAKV